ncbi:MAG: DUF1080 domain-containing protein [Rhodothermales bacterium]
MSPRQLFFLTLLVLLIASCTSETPPRGEPLFDGETFEGWEGHMHAFRIEDGAIVAGTLEDSIPRNEFLCTLDSFDDFELRLEFMLLGEGANAGVQYHTERIPENHEVIGYQADMGDGWWGAIYDEMRRRTLLAEPDFPVRDSLLNVEDWNEYVIRTEGPRTQLFINGVRTVDYTEPDESIPQTGRICVQIHSGPPSEAWYRNITLRDLVETE